MSVLQCSELIVPPCGGIIDIVRQLSCCVWYNTHCDCFVYIYRSVVVAAMYLMSHWCPHNHCLCIVCTVYWRSLNLAICPKSGRNALLAEFKFWWFVTLRHCIDIIVRNFDEFATAKSPNLRYIQKYMHRHVTVWAIYFSMWVCMYIVSCLRV